MHHTFSFERSACMCLVMLTNLMVLGSMEEDYFLNATLTLPDIVQYVLRPFRAFIRAFRNWSAPLPPIFSIASENRCFSEKNGKIFLGSYLPKGPISIVKVLLQFDL